MHKAQYMSLPRAKLEKRGWKRQHLPFSQVLFNMFNLIIYAFAHIYSNRTFKEAITDIVYIMLRRWNLNPSRGIKSSIPIVIHHDL